MKRKLLALLLVAAMAVSCLAFTACGDPAPSETYTGTVSEQTYDSQQAAASAFITKEITSETDVAVLSDCNKEKDLSEEETAALNIPAESGKTVDHVEKWKASYTKAAASSYSAVATAADAADENNYVTVYIIVFRVSGEEITSATVYTYKYYVPLPENGEALSYSYYHSVLKSDNYVNCTTTYTSDTTVTLSDGHQTESETQKITYSMYITESAVKMDLKVADASGTYYIVKTANGGAKAAFYTNGKYTVTSLSDLGINSYEEIFSSQLTDATCSFFIKTDYGFKMNEEKLSKLVSDVLQSLNLRGFRFSNESGKADYYVVEGKLYKVTTEISASVSYSAYGQTATGSVRNYAECKYTNFGTTSVTIPEEVKSLLGV